MAIGRVAPLEAVLFDPFHHNAFSEMLLQLIITSEDWERSKPFPDPYLGASPDHTVVFEDSTIGVQAAGMPVIAIADERQEDKLLAVGAPLVIGDYQDPKLLAALDKTEAAEVNGVK